MITVRLLPDLTGPMDYQMAIDELLLQRFKEDKGLGLNPCPMIRFFDACASWKTFGYTMLVNASDFSKNICRRITGGGWVDHGNDLVFSLIAHRLQDLSFASVLESYTKIHEAIRAGFQSMDLYTDLYPAETGLARGVQCFSTPIQSDLKQGGRKIAGGAQKRSEGSFLHQESIQLESMRLKRSEIKKACRRGFETIYGWNFELNPFDPKMLRQAEELRIQKYANPEFINHAGRALKEPENDE